MEQKYTIGVDFGTQSGRAVLVNIADGTEVADHVTPYPHHVIDSTLPSSGHALGQDWALQHPLDYISVLEHSIPAVIKASQIEPSQVIGLGVDFTSCTMLPVTEDGRPLCLLPKYEQEPHSWVKLWKHHAAQAEAYAITEIAAKRGEKWLGRYGGKISSEWMLAKVWQVLKEAPHIFKEADQFLEAADWVVWQLTGNVTRNACAAGFKSNWHKRNGYPDNGFLKALDLGLDQLMETKLRGDISPLGTKAGGLTKEMAALTGLDEGTTVAVGIIDAHASVPGMGVVTSGKMVMTMGTSVCHLLLADEEKEVPGVCGVVEDGIIPGYYSYEAGQPAVGDLFEWFITNAVPASVFADAEKAGLHVHGWLEAQAAKYEPGQTGLVALDWWNGNRSILNDADLTGTIVGMTLQTKPEEIYRTLLEATAFGTRKIIETFIENGLEVNELYACGGLPQKNNLLMQIYADVTGREIKIAASKQTSALGAAMYAAVAAGVEHGGYNTIEEAASHMAHLEEKTYRPIEANVRRYDELYEIYSSLYLLFGQEKGEASNIMKQLKAMSIED